MKKTYFKYSKYVGTSSTDSSSDTKYSDYADWYDNGPGSESWKRTISSNFVQQMEFPAVKGFPFYKKEEKQFLEDELFEI